MGGAGLSQVSCSLALFFFTFLLFSGITCAASNKNLKDDDAYTAIVEVADEGLSSIEKMFSMRIVDELRQHGYDLFNEYSFSRAEGELTQNTGASGTYGIPAGAAQDDFILGAGDRIRVIFQGDRHDRDTYTIDNEGVLLVDGMPPVSAVGKTIGQIKHLMAREIEQYHDTQVYISLESVHQIGVLVVGHVKKPGRHNLTGFHSVLDAIGIAGGVQKTGSLRKVRLVRDGRSTIIDLYALLMFGSDVTDILLRDGDRIIVPAIGPVVAISGEVKRPGIYEIEESLQGMWSLPEKRTSRISLNEMLEFAAGTLSPGRNRFLRLSVKEDGRELTEDISDAFVPVFGDGDILVVLKGNSLRTGTVELAGHTRTPGMFALDEKDRLSLLLDGDQVLGEDIYPLAGVIERQNKEHFTSEYIEFPPRLVVKGQFDMRLQDGDVVRLFSNDEIRSIFLVDEEKENALIEQGSRDEEDREEFLTDIDPVLVSFLKERSAFVRGAVRSEGPYPVAQGATLDSLIAVSGGFALEASTSNIEITSSMLGEGYQAGNAGMQRASVNLRVDDPAHIAIAPGDTVRVNQKFKKVEDRSVYIAGEISHPGKYGILAGDKISDLIERAGGYSRQAYPEGVIFSRESERKSEELRFNAAAADLERSIAMAVKNEDSAPDNSQLSIARNLISELRNVEGVGRITVEADTSVLAAHPELDIFLESGDRIYIPKRPLNVRVRGEVLSPASLQFRQDRDAKDYISMAGGFTYDADKARSFVVYPDGSAQPLHVDLWNHKPVMIPPGSTIVVPRDPKPFDFIESAEKVSQIIANLALTGIWMDDLQD